MSFLDRAQQNAAERQESQERYSQLSADEQRVFDWLTDTYDEINDSFVKELRGQTPANITEQLNTIKNNIINLLTPTEDKSLFSATFKRNAIEIRKNFGPFLDIITEEAMKKNETGVLKMLYRYRDEKKIPYKKTDHVYLAIKTDRQNYLDNLDALEFKNLSIQEVKSLIEKLETNNISLNNTYLDFHANYISKLSEGFSDNLKAIFGEGTNAFNFINTLKQQIASLNNKAEASGLKNQAKYQEISTDLKSKLKNYCSKAYNALMQQSKDTPPMNNINNAYTLIRQTETPSDLLDNTKKSTLKKIFLAGIVETEKNYKNFTQELIDSIDFMAKSETGSEAVRSEISTLKSELNEFFSDRSKTHQEKFSFAVKQVAKKHNAITKSEARNQFFRSAGKKDYITTDLSTVIDKALAQEKSLGIDPPSLSVKSEDKTSKLFKVSNIEPEMTIKKCIDRAVEMGGIKRQDIDREINPPQARGPRLGR